MDFALTSEQEMLQKMFREFATKEVAKVAEKADKEEALPPRLLKRAASQGFMGAVVPEEPYGGAGLDVVTFTLLLEALAAECASTALTIHVHNSLALRSICRHGTDAAKDALVPEMVAGERIGAFALTEPGAGSDPTHLRTTAVRQGDEFVLNGGKTWVSNGGIAGVFVVFAATDPVAGARGLSAFVVPAEAPGLTVGGREKTLGLNAASIHRIYLNGCRIPVDHLLGAEGDGYKIALETLDFGRVGISAAAVGLARRVVELGVKFASERVAVRRADRRQTGDPGLPGRLRHRSRRGRGAGPPRGLAGRSGSALHPGSVDGEALRRPDGGQCDKQGAAGARRLWLHHGLPDPALLPRRTRAGDRRRHDADPADRDRGRAVRRHEREGETVS